MLTLTGQGKLSRTMWGCWKRKKSLVVQCLCLPAQRANLEVDTGHEVPAGVDRGNRAGEDERSNTYSDAYWVTEETPFCDRINSLMILCYVEEIHNHRMPYSFLGPSRRSPFNSVGSTNGFG